MARDTNSFIRELYERAQFVPLDRYQDWALCELQREIGTDWLGWGTIAPNSNELHTFVEVGRNPYQSKASMLEALRQAEAVPSGSKLDRSSRGRRSARAFCEREPTSGLVSFIAAASPDRGKDQQHLLHLMAPHCLSAWRQAMSFHIHVRRPVDGRAARALVDRHGYVHAGDSRFFASFSCSVDRGGDLLPVIKDAVGGGGGGTHAGVRWTAQRLGDLIFLTSESLGPVGQLTEREQTIVAAIVSGESYGTAAQSLGISTHTVRNTVARVYRKLGVSNKLELLQRTGRMLPSDIPN